MKTDSINTKIRSAFFGGGSTSKNKPLSNFDKALETVHIFKKIGLQDSHDNLGNVNSCVHGLRTSYEFLKTFFFNDSEIGSTDERLASRVL